MKIQCSCGAKYAFDISPEMAQEPVRFVCPACGLDASDFVNSLVRQELGLSGPAAAPAPAPAATPAQPAPQSPPVARVRVHTPASVPVEAAPAAADAPQRCFKHPDQFVVEKCYICSKPLCPKCMELFGYLCSPLCKGKAEAQGIEVPIFAGQKSVREARTWRRTVAVTGTVCGLRGSGAGGMVLVCVVWFRAENLLVGAVPGAVLFRPIRVLRQGPDCFHPRGPPGAARHEAEEGNLVAPPRGHEGDRSRDRARR